MELKDLKKVRVLSALFPDANQKDVDEIITACERWKIAIKEKDERFEAERKKIIEGMNAISEIMKEKNISSEELKSYLDGVKNTSNKRTKEVQPKYRYISLEGQECTWSGRGIIPRTLRALMEQNHTTKEDYLIKQENSEDSLSSD